MEVLLRLIVSQDHEQTLAAPKLTMVTALFHHALLWQCHWAKSCKNCTRFCPISAQQTWKKYCQGHSAAPQWVHLWELQHIVWECCLPPPPPWLSYSVEMDVLVHINHSESEQSLVLWFSSALQGSMSPLSSANILLCKSEFNHSSNPCIGFLAEQANVNG